MPAISPITPTRSRRKARHEAASGAGSCFATADAILGEALDIGKAGGFHCVGNAAFEFETAKRVERASAAVNVFVPAEAT